MLSLYKTFFIYVKHLPGSIFYLTKLTTLQKKSGYFNKIINKQSNFMVVEE